MSRAALAAVVGVVALGACVAVLLVADTGSSPSSERSDFGTLAWEGEPKIFKIDTLPDDRVLAGTLRNDSLAEVEVAAADVELLDRRGRPVAHTAIFSRGFARASYSPRLQVPVGESDQVRLGIKLKLKPGEARALTLAWRVSDPARRPVRVELPQGSLELPRG